MDATNNERRKLFAFLTNNTSRSKAKVDKKNINIYL